MQSVTFEKRNENEPIMQQGWTPMSSTSGPARPGPARSNAPLVPYKMAAECESDCDNGRNSRIRGEQRAEQRGQTEYGGSSQWKQGKRRRKKERKMKRREKEARATSRHRFVGSSRMLLFRDVIASFDTSPAARPTPPPPPGRGNG